MFVCANDALPTSTPLRIAWIASHGHISSHSANLFPRLAEHGWGRATQSRMFGRMPVLHVEAVNRWTFSRSRQSQSLVENT